MKLKYISCLIKKLIPFKDYFKYVSWRMRAASSINSKSINANQSNFIKYSSASITGVVFSKDRAMQLDLLLRSFFETKIGECSIKIIYAYSSEQHKKSYEILRSIYGDKADFISEVEFFGFKKCLEKTILELSTEKVFFLVDDIFFTESIDYDYLSSIDITNAIFSLRMGSNLSFSYVVNSLQPLPKNIECNNGVLLKWKWSDGLFDWAYPLSVDGHIFSTLEVLSWIRRLDFNSPSSFENSLQNIKYLYRNKDGLCFAKSKLVNVPANKVQNEIANQCGSIHQDQLLQLWLDGMVIDYANLRGMKNNSVHQEVDFKYIKRGLST